MDATRKRFLETSRRYLTMPAAAGAPPERVRRRILRREANRFPQTAAVHAALTLLRRCSI